MYVCIPPPGQRSLHAIQLPPTQPPPPPPENRKSPTKSRSPLALAGESRSPSRNPNATLKKPQTTHEVDPKPTLRQTLTKPYINPKPSLNKPSAIFKTNPDETLINPKETLNIPKPTGNIP